jgi:hypothetical protein
VIEQVPARDPDLHARSAPSDAHGFYYFDNLNAAEADTETLQTAKSLRRNVSKTYYPGGELIDRQQVRERLGDDSALLAAMALFDSEFAIKSPGGHYEMFDPEDHELIAR